MSPNIKHASEHWLEEYAGLLESYVEKPTKTKLREAASLSRSLIDSAVPVDDIAATHTASIQRPGTRGRAATDRATRAGQPILLELLKAYGAAYQNQQEANRRLERRVERLQRAVDRLKLSQPASERTPERERLRLLSSAVEQSSEGISMSDLDGNLLFVNSAFAAIHGYTPAEVIGKHLSVFHTPEQMPAVEAASRQIRETGEFNGEIWHLRCDGTVFPTLMHNSLLRDEQGNPIGMIGTLRDITERKRAEEALRRSESWNRALISAIPDMMFRYTRDGTTVDFKPAKGLKPIVPPKDFLGKPLKDVLPTEVAQLILRTIEQALKSKETQTIEYALTLDGAVHDYEGRMIACGDDEVILIVRDVTARKQAEKALRMAEFSVDHAALPTLWIGADARLLRVNDAACRALGYSRAELLSMTVHDLDPNYPAERWPDHWRDVMQRGSMTFESRSRTKDGRIIPIEVNVKWLEFNGQEYHIAFARDITERKRAEEALHKAYNTLDMRVKERTAELAAANERLEAELTERKRAENALRESERRFRSFLDDLDDAAYRADAQGNITYGNKFGESLTGLPVKEIIGKAFLPLFTEESQPVAADAYQRTLNGESPEYELKFTTGKIGHFRNKPWRDEDGSIVGVFGIVRDITERKQMEQALRESEETVRALLNATMDVLLLIDVNGTTLAANEALAASLGRRVDELIGRCIFDFLPPDVAKLRREKGEEARRSRKPVRYTDEHAGRYLDTVAYPLFDRAGNVDRLAVFARDVTERFQAQQALQRSEEYFRSLIEDASDIVMVVDADATVQYISPSVKRILAYEAQDVVGRKIFEFAHPDDLPDVTSAFTRVSQAAGQIAHAALRVRHHDGSWRTFEGVAKNLLDNLAIRGIVVNSWDVTERKRAEEALRESEEQLRLITDSLPVLISYVDPDQRYRFNNKGYEEWFGVSRAEAEGRHLKEVLGDQVYQRIRPYVEAALSGRKVTFENEVPYKGGGTRDVTVTYVPHLGEAGQIRGFFALVVDMTERKRTDEALRESEARYRQLFATVSDAIMVFDAETRQFLDVNDAASGLYGYTKTEFLGLSHPEITAEPEYSDASIRETLKGKLSRIPLRYHRKKDGTIFPVEISASTFTVGNRRVLCGVVRDITERRRAEDTLRLLSQAVESAADGIAMADPDNKITYVNGAFAKMFGYSKEELIGKDIAFMYPKGQIRELEEALKATTDGGWTGELVGRRKNGELFPLAISSSTVVDDEGNLVAQMASHRDITEPKRAEEALRESEEKLAGILGAVTDHISMIDEEHTIVWANDTARRLFGPHLVGRKCYSAYHRRDQVCESCVASKAFADSGIHEHETEVVGADGKTMRFWCTASVAARHEDGRPKMVVEVSRDITERKRAEGALRESEELFRTVVNASKDAMVAVGRAGLVTIFNPAAEEMFGRPREEMVGQPLDALMPEEYRQRHRQYVARYFGAGTRGGAVGRTLELPAVRNDGSVFPVELSLSAGRQADGPFVLAVIRDATERKRAEEAVRESEERFRQLAEHIREVFWLYDVRLHKVIYVSPAYEAIWDRPRQQLYADPTSWIEAVHPDERARAQAAFEHQRTGERFAEEYRIVRPDGSVRWIRDRGFPVAREDGQVYRLAGIAEDITEQRRIEQALQEQRAILANVLDHIPHSVFWKDKNLFYLGCNKKFARDANVETPKDIVGKTDYDLPWRSKQAEFYRGCDQQVIRTGEPLLDIEEPSTWADGTEAVVLTSKTPLRDLEGNIIGVLGIYADITDRKRMEETLRRQALVFENMYDAVVVTDASNRVIDWNPGAQRMFGYARDEVLGQTTDLWHKAEHVPVLLREIEAGIERHGRWSGEISFVRKDGSEGLCETVIVGLRDNQNNFLGTIGVGRDITDRRRAEEEARHRQAELARVARVAAMGALTSGLAHEINQPLSAVLNYARGCARRLRQGQPDADEVLGVMERVTSEAERASAIIESLRAFVGKGKPRFSLVQLNALVKEAVVFVEHVIREWRVSVDLQLSESLPPVSADAVQIEQVILNLLRNGIEAMQETAPGVRRLTLRTFNAGSDAVALAVSDTGSGLSADAGQHLFEPLFTTKPDGLGLGLSISRSIIEMHGGRLWATLNPDSGATLTFSLPVAKEA